MAPMKCDCTFIRWQQIWQTLPSLPTENGEVMLSDHVFYYNLKGYLILLWHEVGSCKHLLDFLCFPIHKVENCLYFAKAHLWTVQEGEGATLVRATMKTARISSNCVIH